MQAPPDLTDRTSLNRNRLRAYRLDAPAMFLQQAAALEIQERLALVNRTFTAPAIVTPFPEIWGNVVPHAQIIADSETLDIQAGAHDLVIHGMALHWANDPVGQLVQAHRALRPDGLFLGAMFGGQTLHELRAALAEAEVSMTGGLSPRVAPMAEIRDIGGLLQRAGFALPVADSLTQKVTYETALHLMRDLRAMGEANALAARNRTPMRRSVLAQTISRYANAFTVDDRVAATFEMIYLTGWAPADSQPKPLRPGSAQARLADALGVDETPGNDPAKPWDV